MMEHPEDYMVFSIAGNVELANNTIRVSMEE